MAERIDTGSTGRHGAQPVPPPAPPDEIVLAAGLRRGDPAAFEALVRQHAPRMLAVARRLLRDPEDARDVVQEAFLSALRGCGEFGGQSKLGTWLHRIVVNAALMRIRSRGRHPEESIEPLLPRFHDDGHMVDPAGPWRETADGELAREELRALVRRSIARLPDTYRTVLILRDIEELEPQETASLLGISVNAVNIRLHRARQALRTLLDPLLRRDGACG